MRSGRVLLLCLLMSIFMGLLGGCKSSPPQRQEKVAWQYSAVQLKQVAEDAAQRESRQEYRLVELLFRRADALCRGAQGSGDCSGIVIEGTRSVGAEDEVYGITFGILGRVGEVLASVADDTGEGDRYQFAVITELNELVGVHS